MHQIRFLASARVSLSADNRTCPFVRSMEFDTTTSRVSYWVLSRGVQPEIWFGKV